jgi:transcriptional regulator with XRE-family HTH domain
MPRPNQPRSIASEHALARRIANERERRGWSYDGLASRMTKAGCAIQSSAIYKIEKSDPPRRITVDELVAFAEVFAVPVQDLLLPPEIAAKRQLVGLLTDWEIARRRSAEAKDVEETAWGALTDYVSGNPEVEGALEASLKGWVEHYFDESERDGAMALKMWQITKSEKWIERVRAELDAD